MYGLTNNYEMNMCITISVSRNKTLATLLLLSYLGVNMTQLVWYSLPCVLYGFTTYVCFPKKYNLALTGLNLM